MTISSPSELRDHLGIDAAEVQTILTAAALASRDVLRAPPARVPKSAHGRDIKLPEDEASERLIVAFLKTLSSWPILSEEAGWVEGIVAAGDDPYWAIDPLDGSYNFHRSVPLCCTSVALCVGPTPLAGAIFDFNRDELFFGGPGIGLQINGTPIIRPSRAKAILATGMPVRADYAGGSVEALAERLQSATKVRMIGSAALSLAWVAAGRFDSYHENGISWWDVAAGLALVSGAGGNFVSSPIGLDQSLSAPLAVTANGAAW